MQQTNPFKIKYQITVVKSTIQQTKSKKELVGLNRLFANIEQQDLGSGFDDDYLQFVIPRHLNNVLSYIYEGHNIKIW